MWTFAIAIVMTWMKQMPRPKVITYPRRFVKYNNNQPLAMDGVMRFEVDKIGIKFFMEVGVVTWTFKTVEERDYVVKILNDRHVEDIKSYSQYIIDTASNKLKVDDEKEYYSEDTKTDEEDDE